MIKDIVPELLNSIQQDFEKHYHYNKTIQRLLDKESLTYGDAHDYAVEVGQALSRAYLANIDADTLPNGRLYYNIANRLLPPTLTHNYNLTADYCMNVQENLNQSANITIQPQRPTLNENRILNFVDKISNELNFRWLLESPVVNFTQSIVDDAIKANAEFHAKSGLAPVIIRKANAGACDWCRKIAGRYDYGEEPGDVYRRHQNCTCKTEYDPGDGRGRQDVWSKSWKTREEQDKIEERIAFSQSYLRASGAKNYFRDTQDDYLRTDEEIRKDKHAYLEYDRIKNSNQELEKRKIFNNIGQFEEMKGFSKEDVDIAFDHVFNIEHELENGKGLFTPDFEMAQSWNRLINNDNIQSYDLILLKHERLEHNYMYKEGLDYNEAHEMTEKTYFYDPPSRKER